MKLRVAKRNEERVVKLLNLSDPSGKMILHKDHYSRYDVGGVYNGKFTIVEVKLRKTKFPTWFIEVEKLSGIYKQAKEEGFNWETGNKYICCSYEDEHCFYNINDIVKNPRVKRWMNATTAKGFKNQGEKVEKEVFEFSADSYEFKL